MITASKIEQHVNEFEGWMESRHYSPKSATSYGRTIRQFLNTNPWGDEYNYKDVIEYFEKLSARQNLPTVVRKYMLIHIKRYYDYLVFTGKRDDHPCRSLHFKGRKDRGVIQSDLFTMEEMQSILKKAGEMGKQTVRHQAIVSFMVYQALKTEEIRNLKIKDINLAEGIINIQSSRKSNGRQLDMSHDQITMVIAYMNVRKSAKPTDPLLINQYNAPITERSITDTLLFVKGMYPHKELNPVMLRKSVLSHWLNVRKIPVEDVQLLAGIRWVSSLEKYLQPTQTEDQEVLKKYHPFG